MSSERLKIPNPSPIPQAAKDPQTDRPVYPHAPAQPPERERLQSSVKEGVC
mgnify:CR=1 FL=1